MSPATVVPQALALLTQILRMLLGLIRYVKPVRFVQRSLLVRIYVDVTLNALLSRVGPAVTAHPFAFAQRTFEFAKASFLPLVWSEAFAFWSGLKKKQIINMIWKEHNVKTKEIGINKIVTLTALQGVVLNAGELI